MTGSDFEAVARQRIEDAKALRDTGGFAGALYMCGYAVECALKASICRHQVWEEYKLDPDYRLMKTHSFEFLVSFCGREFEIKENVREEWAILKSWNPNWRYLTTPSVNVDAMIRATEAIMNVLL
jgi:HEPN domain-containing protein